MSLRRIAVLVGAGVALCVPAARALDVGDEAPEIKIAHWAKNGPITLAEGKGKKVYVVEFWATWCGPCRASIPHLATLYTRLKEQGLEIIGVTREDQATVDAFPLKDQFTYHVGCDDDGATHDLYMEGVPGIPHAFVVDKSGKVAWHGHPMDHMDTVVEQVLAGTFDAGKAAEAVKARRLLSEAMETEDQGLIRAAAADVLKLAPGDSQAFGVLAQVFRMEEDPAGFKKLCREQVAACEKTNADALNQIAWTLLTIDDLAYRDLRTALQAARGAAELAKGTESEASIVDTLARTYAELGLWDRAVAEQERAVKLAGEGAEGLKATLEYYREARTLAREQGAAATTPAATK